MTGFSRRDVFAGAALATGSIALSSLASTTAAQAEAPASGQQVPSIYRYKVGNYELTSVSDGARTVPLSDKFVRNATIDEVNAALEAAFLPKGEIPIQFNPLLINTGAKLVLLDTGNGAPTGNATVGRLQQNLNWAGVKPAAVDTVIISHFHGDHINGLRIADGGLAFPNAEIMVPKPEWDFWMDDGQMSRAPEGMQAAFQNVRRIFKDLDSKITKYEWDKEIVPGITTVNAAGHTPGHTAYVVANGDDKLFVQSDITNRPELFVRNPDWQAMFDMDGDKARDTRRKVFDMLVAERLPVTGYHFAFPALGHIEKDGNGYRLVPVPWSPVL